MRARACQVYDISRAIIPTPKMAKKTPARAGSIFFMVYFSFLQNFELIQPSTDPARINSHAPRVSVMVTTSPAYTHARTREDSTPSGAVRTLSDSAVTAQAAGGVGLNLQEASAVINFEPPWNPARLEQRIGLLTDDEDLVAMESQLRDRRVGSGEIRIAELIPPEAIQVPLAARTRNSVVRAMIDAAARTGWLWDPEAMREAVLAREEMHPTALENGVALLHPRRPLPNILGQAFIGFGRTMSGIPFGSESGVLTDCFFLICSVEERSHLRTLARLSRILTVPGFLPRLRELESPREIRGWIAETEAGL